MNQAEIDQYQNLLADSVAFRELDSSVLERIMKQGLLLEAKTGDLVFFESMRGGFGLYVILEGEVDIFLPDKQSTEAERPSQVHLNTLGAGHCFGEYSLLDGKDTSASAKALSDIKLFFLPRPEFLQVTGSDPLAGKTIYRNLLLYLVNRLRHKDEDLDLMIAR